MKAYLNGEFVEREEAKVSVDDRGFLFADGIYDVARSYYGRLFRFDDHLSRLRDGCERLRLEFNQFDKIENIAYKLLEENDLMNCQAVVYIQITRGAAKRTHRFPPKGTLPTVYIAASGIEPNLDELRNGINAITVPDERWNRRDIKSIALLPNILANQEAHDRDASEAIFTSLGFVWEGTHSNLFALFDDILVTTPRSQVILSGITRLEVLDICKRLGVKYIEKRISDVAIGHAREIFITSTTLEITPVVKMDWEIISDGLPGPLTRKIQNEFYKTVGVDLRF